MSVQADIQPRPAVVVPPRAKLTGGLAERQNGLAWALLTPALAVVVLVAFVPLVQTILQSFTDARLASARPVNAVGLKNYIDLIQDGAFWNSIRVTIIFTVLTVAFEFFRYEFPRLEVTIDGVAHAATFAVVCHARHYAGDWLIAPEASLDSEEMEVLLFSGRGRWKFLSLFRQIQLGKSGHLSRSLATIVRGADTGRPDLAPGRKPRRARRAGRAAG